jgi:hypothetical protein
MLQLNNHNIILPKYLSFVKESPCEFFRKKESRRNPARIPPQTPPAGGKSVEAGRIRNPRQIVSPCRVLFSSFNHLDFARNSFELCPTNTAKIENRNRKPKYGRREAPSVLNSPQKILNLKGFATLRMAPRLPIQNYE